MTMKTGIALLLTLLISSTHLTVMAAPGDGARDRVHRDQQVDRDRDFDRDRDRDFDRDRLRDRDRIDEPARDRDRIQDRTHVPDFAKLKDDDIYGSEVMTRQERNEYRNRLRDADSDQAREQIRAEHQHEVRMRAQEQGVTLKPAPEGPIYGGAMLSQQERNQYRARLREIESPEERGKFMAEHREQMQARARAQGVPFEDLDED